MDRSSFTPKNTAPAQAGALVQQLENLLQNVYADLSVSRTKVSQLIQQGRVLSENEEVWPGGVNEVQEFQSVLDRLEKKINQALDLKRLKEEGLVKAVKL